jgi:monoamine oxidase
MARTALLRTLQRIARQHQAAWALGIGTDELRMQGSRVAHARISRRDFARRTGAIGATVAAAGSLGRLALGATPAYGDTMVPAHPSKPSPRIAIIGGGIAGLAAALTLQDAGYSSDIYESSGRVGGRMHSDWTEFGSSFWADGQHAELCGELIDTDHTTILGLCKRFRLTVVDLLAAQQAGTTDTYWVNGAAYSVSQATSDFQPVWNTLQSQVNAIGPDWVSYNDFTSAGQFFDKLTVRDWIKRYVPGGVSSNLGAMLNAAYNEEFGAETSGQSSLNLIGLVGFGDSSSPIEVLGPSDERFHIAGGNSLLPLAIAAAVPRSSIHLGCGMTAIGVKGDGSIAISFGNGKTVIADEVILALPFAILRTLDYSKAGFDSLKKKAITQQGTGRNVKLNMQFASRVWVKVGSDGSLYTDLPVQAGWDVTRAQSGTTGIWVEYPGANVSASMAQSTPYSTTATNPKVTTFARQALAQLEAIYPGITAAWNGKAMLSTPFTDPNLLLSYAYYKPGQYTGFSGYEAVRQGNIHFAGEHTSTSFQGYMEGGAETGISAASEIIADIKSHAR